MNNAFLSSVHIYFNPLPIGVSSTTFVVYFSAPSFSLCDKSIAFLLGALAKCFFRLFFSIHSVPGRTYVSEKFFLFFVLVSQHLQTLNLIQITLLPFTS